ncbi:MAG: hypothetical protein ACKOU7_02325 [Ferruginibacter sp.]
MLKVLFELFVLYLVYKLIFDFIIPVYNATKQASQKMSEMQSKMNDHFSQSAGSGGQRQANTTAEKPPKPAREDYIEFEEVK